MKRIPLGLRLLGITCTFVLLLLLQRSFIPASASSAVLESRLSRLEAENIQLRAKLSRLESQINRLAGGLDTRIERINPPNQPSPPMGPDVSPPSASRLGDDPMFKRLATLVVELKERVTVLEKRLKELER